LKKGAIFAQSQGTRYPFPEKGKLRKNPSLRRERAERNTSDGDDGPQKGILNERNYFLRQRGTVSSTGGEAHEGGGLGDPTGVTPREQSYRSKGGLSSLLREGGGVLWG